MSPAWIRRRQVKVSRTHPRGVTYQVVWRYGGPGSQHEKPKSGGAFPTEREARMRRDLIAGWLAQGLDPALELARLSLPAPAPVTFEQKAWEWVASRVDVDESTREGYRRKLNGRILPLLGDRPVKTLTEEDAQQVVAELSRAMKPSSVKAYIAIPRMVLDYAKVRPNPFRDETVRLPKDVAEEARPPSAPEVIRIAEKIAPGHLLALATVEITGVRIGELASLGWGDVDTIEAKFRLSRVRTKTDRARWVQLPRWLMDAIEDTCPFEDRLPERRVFPRSRETTFRAALYRACRLAGTIAYSPHDLRHRRISLWHGQGIPWKEIADRVGHVKASETLDTYSHVLLDPTEISAEQWASLLRRAA